MLSSGAPFLPLSLPVQQTNVEKKVKQKEILVVKDHRSEVIAELVKNVAQQSRRGIFLDNGLHFHGLNVGYYSFCLKGFGADKSGKT